MESEQKIMDELMEINDETVFEESPEVMNHSSIPEPQIVENITMTDESTELHALSALTPSSTSLHNVTDIIVSDESMTVHSPPPVTPFTSSPLNLNDANEASTSHAGNLKTKMPLRINKETLLYRHLLASGDGRKVFNAQPTAAGFLTNQSRNRLTRFIVQIELDAAVKKVGDDPLDDFKIMGKKLQKWAEEIVKTFPGETSSTYYVPYQSKNQFDRTSNAGAESGLNAHGKLAYHYEYQRGVLKESGVIKTKKVEPDNPLSSCQLDMMKILKSKISPWVEVVSLWNKSHESRKQLLKSKKISVENYFNSYAALQTQQGLELLEADFRIQFPDHDLRLKNNWGKVREYLIQKLQDSSVRDVSHKAYIHLLPTLSPDIQDVIILYLLPYLVEIGKNRCKRIRLDPDIENIQANNSNTSSSTNKKNKGPATKKPSFQERQDNFIIHLENAIDIEAIINQVRSRSEAVVLKYQPIPVITGKLLNPTKFYVLINNKIYEVPSIINAIDSVFKCCWAFDCEYPQNATSLWIFIQRGFYGIEYLKQKIPSNLSAMIGEVIEIIKQAS